MFNLKKKVLRDLKKAVAFSDLSNCVDYAVLTGGFILNENRKCDIDLIIVLKNDVKVNGELKNKIKKFSLEHVNIQAKYNFLPDLDFPTYVVTKSQIVDTLNGRPFEYLNKKIFLKTFSRESWEKDLGSDYRVLLYQLISHDYDIFFGDIKSLQKDTEESLTQIFLYTYSIFGYSSEEFLDKKRLFRSLFFSAGLNYSLGLKTERQIIDLLNKKGFAKINKNRVYLNHGIIEKNIFEYLNFYKKEEYEATHIMKWEELNKYIKSNFYDKKVIDKIYDYIFNAKSRHEEWKNWHDRTTESIKKIKNDNEKPKELSDPDEKRYYALLGNFIVNNIPKNTKKIIEIGSGSGTLSVLLKERFPKSKVYLLDNSEVAIEYSRLINKEAVLILGNATSIPLKCNSFDFAYSVGLIEHFDDYTINKMLRETNRILKEGGYFYLAVPNFFSPDIISIWGKNGKGSEKYISKNRLKKYAEDAGFKVVRVGYSDYVNNFFTRHPYPKIEKIIGINGFGFLNYVLSRKL